MKTHSSPPDYKGFRFPPEIISHAVWLYFRFSLSFRDVEELLAQRGIVVTYETLQIRKTGPTLSFCFRSYRWPFSTAKAPYERSGLPCHFTEPIPNLE